MITWWLNTVYWQDNRAPGLGSVWHSEQRGVAGAGWRGGGGEDAAGWDLRGGHGQVPAGGSHQWAV